MREVTTYLSAIPYIMGWHGDLNHLHKQIWKGFPDVPSGERAPFLYRIDADRNIVLVRSTEVPEWLFPAEVTEERFRITEGSMFTLDVLMNPIRRSHGAEVFIRDPDEVKAFMQRRLLHAGVRPLPDLGQDDGDDFCDDEVLLQSHSMAGVKITPRKGRRFTLYLKRCVATVEVVDPERFEEAVRHGVGRKRRYGCGMVLVYPAGMVL